MVKIDRPLTERNFSFHLKKTSSLLKSALNCEVLDTLQPWKSFSNYLVEVSGQFEFSTIATIAKDEKGFPLTDVAYTSWPEAAVTDFLEYGLFNDPLMMAVHRKSSQGLNHCFSIAEVVSLQEYQRSPFFNEFARPHKVDALTQMFFTVNRSEYGGLAVFNPSGCYEVKPIVKKFLSELGEDVGMALNHRHLLKRLQTAQASLNRLNLGVILLNEQGFVEMLNEQAETLLSLGDPLFISHNRLYTTDPGSTERLHDLCYRLLRGETRQREHQFILKSVKGNPPLQIIALSLENKLSESLMGGYVPTALFINHPDLSGQLSINLEQVFQEFYGCGKKQAQVATLFTKGCSETEIAKSLDIGKETVRSHLNQVSEKLRDRVRSPKRRKQVFWDVALQHYWPLR